MSPVPLFGLLTSTDRQTDTLRTIPAVATGSDDDISWTVYFERGV